MPTSLVPAPITSATVDRLSLTAETVRGTAPDAGLFLNGVFVACSLTEVEASGYGPCAPFCFEAE